VSVEGSLIGGRSGPNGRRLKRQCPKVGLLHRSDRGSTSASEDYQKVLAGRGVVCSMSRRGDPHASAVMDARNSTFKVACGERFLNHEIARSEASSTVRPLS
jgi:putative transposase